MVYHAVACLLCAWALVTGIRTTFDLDWPFDPDHLRDIAHAQTIRDGAWLQDPFYQSEWVWYNPLLPGVIAGISYLTDLPVNIVAARAGAYLNIAAPLTFYLLVRRLTSPPTALASLVGFLFLVRAPTWAAPTYSPWLFGSAFAQPFFYLTLAEYHAASVSGRLRRYSTAGILLGLTFLTHTAPAILAASMIATITIARTWIEKRQPRELLIILSLVAGPALLIGLPFLASIVGHYQLQCSERAPADMVGSESACGRLAAAPGDDHFTAIHMFDNSRRCFRTVPRPGAPTFGGDRGGMVYLQHRLLRVQQLRRPEPAGGWDPADGPGASLPPVRAGGGDGAFRDRYFADRRSSGLGVETPAAPSLPRRNNQCD